MAELIRRRIVPAIVIRLATIDWPARAAAALRRATGRRGRVELYFAFDDPCSAVALIELARRTAGREVDLVLLPVVERGIADDPAVEDKRRYAIVDARRLGRRAGLTLSRDEPLQPADTAFLAARVPGAVQGPGLVAACALVMERLWFGSSGPVSADDYPELPPPEDPAAVRANERRMVRRGPYETPAAVVAGQWFFAHDRLAQIVHRLDALGWKAAA
jgi:2-hydroxychromene-2-carboxylate isomerase